MKRCDIGMTKSCHKRIFPIRVDSHPEMNSGVVRSVLAGLSGRVPSPESPRMSPCSPVHTCAAPLDGRRTAALSAGLSSGLWSSFLPAPPHPARSSVISAACLMNFAASRLSFRDPFLPVVFCPLQSRPSRPWLLLSRSKAQHRTTIAYFSSPQL